MTQSFPTAILAALVIMQAAAVPLRSVTHAAGIAKAVRDMETNVAFQVEATVTCIPHYARLGIADESGPATITDFHHNRFDGIRAGDRVSAAGYTKISTNSLIPTAYCERISVLSHGRPPEPADVSPEDFHSGRLDHAYVRVRGVVRDVFVDEIDPSWVFLVVGSGRGSVSAALNIERTGRPDLADVEGSDVAVSGICVRQRVDRRSGSRHVLRRILEIPDMAGIKLLRQPPEDPFDVPEVMSTRNMSPEELSATGKRRATGKVLATWGGRHLLLATPGGVLRCDLKDDTPPDIGECVDVAGLPTTDLFRVNLSRATWRKAQSGVDIPEEKPEALSAEQLFTDENGKPKVQTKYHGRIVTVSGIVRSLPPEGSLERRLYLESGKFTLPVDIGGVPDALKRISIGCEIAATGVCVAESDVWTPHSSFPHIRSLFLVLRTPDDVQVLRHPPWWTPQRLFVAIASLLFVILVILIWNLLLRRLAERRGRQLAEELVARAETDMKVLERTRLAVELHDSVAQNLAGVAMELETARQFQEGAHVELIGHLNTAFRTLKSCRDELRNCLWDLRSQSLEEPDMETAIRRTLTPHVKGVSLAIRFNVPRAIISDNTTHALLCIIRELVVNGIRHGKASSIKIAGGIEDDALRFSVSDDGCGFDPERRPGIESGHYGLQGIRERVSRLGGRMTVESSPGTGTKATITIHIPKGQTQAEGKT